jgi:hypothetical protein
MEVRVKYKGGEHLKGLNDAFFIPLMIYKDLYLVDLQHDISNINNDGSIK